MFFSEIVIIELLPDLFVVCEIALDGGLGALFGACLDEAVKDEEIEVLDAFLEGGNILFEFLDVLVLLVLHHVVISLVGFYVRLVVRTR